MTEPSQYFKGRTVQEQMNEVIGYVDVRAEEVAAAKADDVLEPAEQAKDDAIAAKEAAEQARDTTLAALPQIQQDITDLKAEDVALDGRLDTVELKVTTAEGNIVTIQGQITALQTADGQNVKLTGEHAIGNYAVLLTGNQANIKGNKSFDGELIKRQTNFDPKYRPTQYVGLYPPILKDSDNNDVIRYRLDMSANSQTIGWQIYQTNNQGVRKSIALGFRVNKTTGACSLILAKSDGTESALASWQDDTMKDE